MGSVPKILEQTIQGGFDLTEFLLLNREPVVGNVNLSVIGNQAAPETAVPPGELWYIHAAEARTGILAAGETVAIQLCYSQSGVNISQGQQQTATAGARCVTFAGGFWIPSGGQISVRANQITTVGNIPVQLSALVTRLRI